MESNVQNIDNLSKHPLEAARSLARLLDDVVKIPGTRFGVGLDPILNLIPYAGDAAGTAMSAILLVTAVGMNVPKRVLARMLLNISIDALVGAIPMLGQIFDFFWKANRKNFELLEEYAVAPDKIKAQSGTVVASSLIFVLVLMLIIVGTALYLTFTVFSWFTTWFTTWLATI
jgi:hypothetical protein